MSEYQYYEFQTVDHRLTEQEMTELRAYSTRAHITPSGFSNEYHFGSFKGNADAWMEKYFEGFLYLANWGSRELQLALPKSLVPLETANRYGANQVASCREHSGKRIFKFRSEQEPDGEWLEGKGQLSSVLPICNELVQGDLRSLYLGWLLGVAAGEITEPTEEPPVPPNLAKLSEPQKYFAEFLRLDPDLVTVAARNSPSIAADDENNAEMLGWIRSLPEREKDEILAQLMTGRVTRVGLELHARFRQNRAGRSANPVQQPRTAGQLLSAAKIYRQQREGTERRQAAIEKARQEAQAAVARAKLIESLKGRSHPLWLEVETLAAVPRGKNYAGVVQHLVNLCDLAKLESKQASFKSRLQKFRHQHATKKALQARLDQAGL